MREIRTSGSMSGDGKRDDVRVATAPILDSTENKGPLWKKLERSGNVVDCKEDKLRKRECYVRPNGADRQWVEVPPR
jgi:hypothetical protein